MSRNRMSLALAPIVLGISLAAIVPASAAPPMQCEIRAIAVPGGIRLESVAFGSPGLSGSYQLSLERSGASGSSNMSQGGDFEVGDDGEVVISVTEFNLGPHDKYNVALTIESSSGATYCEHVSL